MKAKRETNQTSGQKDQPNSTMSRRVLLSTGALTATAFLGGCVEKHDGYGKPLPDEPAGLQFRANLALWLLLTTNPNFLSVTKPDANNYTTVDVKLDMNNLAKDLKYLSATPQDYITSLKNYIGQNPSFAQWVQVADASGNNTQVKANINYGIAIQAVQGLFQALGTGGVPGTGAPYGSGQNCPHTNIVLSLVSDNPVTQDPASQPKTKPTPS